MRARGTPSASTRRVVPTPFPQRVGEARDSVADANAPDQQSTIVDPSSTTNPRHAVDVAADRSTPSTVRQPGSACGWPPQAGADATATNATSGPSCSRSVPDRRSTRRRPNARKGSGAYASRKAIQSRSAAPTASSSFTSHARWRNACRAPVICRSRAAVSARRHGPGTARATSLSASSVEFPRRPHRDDVRQDQASLDETPLRGMHQHRRQPVAPRGEGDDVTRFLIGRPTEAQGRCADRAQAMRSVLREVDEQRLERLRDQLFRPRDVGDGPVRAR